MTQKRKLTVVFEYEEGSPAFRPWIDRFQVLMQAGDPDGPFRVTYMGATDAATKLDMIETAIETDPEIAVEIIKQIIDHDGDLETLAEQQKG